MPKTFQQVDQAVEWLEAIGYLVRKIDTNLYRVSGDGHTNVVTERELVALWNERGA